MSSTSGLVEAPFPIRGRKLLLLADGAFSDVDAKTAACLVMYRADEVAAVLDAGQAGRAVSDVLGYGGDIPVVATVGEGVARGAEVAVVGTAPMGGLLDGALREQLRECAFGGLDIVSGLHVFLAEDAALAALARERGVRIWDVRRVPDLHTVSTGAGCTTGARAVAVVGSDCNVGKMTVALELSEAVSRRGIASAWAATGQTGMMLRERGIAIDRVIADFVGGATETLVNFEGAGQEVVFVEGQGAITHPGYAGVTLGMLYGTMPDCMVLAHVAGRERMKRLELPVPPLPELIELYEALMAPHRPSRVVGVALNTKRLGEKEAHAELDRVTDETGRPAFDVIRFGCDGLADAVLAELGL